MFNWSVNDCVNGGQGYELGGGRGDWMSLMYTCTYLVRLEESVSEQKNGVGLKLQVQYKLQ